MTKTLIQRIGESLRDRREDERINEYVLGILRTNGYKDSEFEGQFSDDINIIGKPNKYSERYQFGTPFIDCSEARYAIVPVHHTNSYYGHEDESLVLVDRQTKKTATIAHSGDRRVHYNGRCKLKPLALEVTDDKKLILSYKYTLHADLKNPIKVDNSIWRKYLFRYSDFRIAQFDLTKLEVSK